MPISSNEFRQLLKTVSELLKAEGNIELYNLLLKADAQNECTNWDNWNGGTEYLTIYISIDATAFVRIKDRLEEMEKNLLDRFTSSFRRSENTHITGVKISPKASSSIDWARLGDTTTREKVITEANYLKDTMVSVATGGADIKQVNPQYQQTFALVDKALKALQIENPNPYKDLWQWHGKWKGNTELSTWASRRVLVGNIYDDLLKSLVEDTSPEHTNVIVDISEWDRLGRSISEIKRRQTEAQTEEQFQAVGLLCRDTLITLAQAIFVAEKHLTIDGIKASATDTKRMLEAYISVELQGSANDTLRKYMRATNDLANELAHKRTATKRDAILCAIATICLINLMGTVAGRHL